MRQYRTTTRGEGRNAARRVSRRYALPAATLVAGALVTSVSPGIGWAAMVLGATLIAIAFDRDNHRAGSESLRRGERRQGARRGPGGSAAKLSVY